MSDLSRRGLFGAAAVGGAAAGALALANAASAFGMSPVSREAATMSS